jgi:ATP-binding cassette, subfamily C (CFTR/MRP), member 1
MAMIRGGLIAIIYQKMIGLKTTNVNESAAMTLMGTDVERIAETCYLLVAEISANVIQLGVAIWLLERQLGTVCIAPIIVALGEFCSLPSLPYQ